MSPDEFDPTAPGKLVPIPGGHAFLPSALPPGFAVSHAVLDAVAKAERALGLLTGHADAVQNDFLIQRPLLTREAVKSARIEGTYVVVSDVLRHEAAGPPADPGTALDNMEVIRYLHSLDSGVGWLRQSKPITATFIRGLHQSLLESTRGEEKHPGEYRTGQVAIGAEGDNPLTARFVPAPPVNIPGLMDDLVAFMQEPAPWSPLVAAAISHYQFETIHPFEDGNGRLGRLLIPLFLMDHGVIGRPLIYLSDFLDSNRESYFDHLKSVSCHDRWQEWVEFFLEAVRVTAMDGVERIQRITSLRERYRSAVVENSRSQTPLAAVDLVMEKVIVSVAEVQGFSHCSYPTAKAALDTLTKLGIVAPLAGTFPARWVANELIDQVYN